VTQLPCYILFGSERGAQIQAAVEEDTGAPCPCAQGRGCVLLSDELEPLADASHRIA
jgi:hypothetical protein